MTPKAEKGVNLYVAIITTLMTILMGVFGYLGSKTLNNVEILQQTVIKNTTNIDNQEKRITHLEDNADSKTKFSGWTRPTHAMVK